jgi:hypothetical protein
MCSLVRFKNLEFVTSGYAATKSNVAPGGLAVVFIKKTPSTFTN